jgi:hypothetical protein
MTPKQAMELTSLLNDVRKSVDTLRKVSQSNTDFIVVQLEDLIARIDLLLGTL